MHKQLRVAAPADGVFAVLTDLRQTLRCVPGVRSTDDGTAVLHGSVALRGDTGTLRYEGSVRLVDADPSAHRVRLSLECRGTGGGGIPQETGGAEHPEGDVPVQADLTVTVHPTDGGARVELEIAAEPAGTAFPSAASGVIDHLWEQIARNLEAAAAAATPSHRKQAAPSPAAEPPASAAPATSGQHARSMGPALRTITAAAAAGLLLGWLLGRWGKERP